MKKLLLKHGLLTAVVVLSAFTLVPLTVSAQTTNSEASREEKIKEHHEKAKATADARKEAAKTRLESAKLRACENRQKAITNIMSRIADRGQKQLDLFSTIADRTQAFYEKKGKVLANYDALIADMATKKEAAQETIDMTKSHSASFDCSGEDPKGVASSFKEHSKATRAALKEYKTSVKNLIVGVKSVQSQAVTESEQE